MLLRLSALCCLFSIPSALSAAPLPKDPARGMPHLVIQTKSIDGILNEYEHVHKRLDGIGASPDRKTIEIKFQSYYPDWRNAVDTTKPLGGYVIVQPVIEKSRPVFLLPFKQKDPFLQLMKMHFPDFGEEDGKGLYQGSTNFIFSKINLYMRLKNDYAYITFSDSSAIEDVAKLPNPAEILLKEETALIAMRLYIEGIPEETKQTARDFLKQIAEKPEHVGWTEMLAMGLLGTADTRTFAERLRSLVDEAKWASIRLELDQKNDRLALEFNLVPRKVSDLGKDIAVYKPKLSRLAGLLDQETAAGALLSQGNFGGLKIDVQIVDELLRQAMNGVDLQGSERARGLLAKAVVNSIKVDQADIGVALKMAPGKETYTLVVGAKLSQPKLLALAMFGYMQSTPKEQRNRFTMNAVKLDDEISAHKLTLPNLKDETKEFFGEPDLYFCQKGEMIFAAFGSGAPERLKECLKLEEKEGPQLLVEIDPAKITGIFPGLNAPEDLLRRWKQTFPKSAKSQIFTGKVEGGSMLRVTYTLDLIPALKIGLGSYR